MSASLLELVIPASVSIVIACGTVIWTTVSNRRLEDKKIRSTKKEEIYSLFLRKLSFIYTLHIDEYKGSMKYMNIAKSLINENDEITLKITLLSRLYFPELDGADLIDSNFYTSYLIKDIASGRVLSEDRYTTTMNSLNKLVDKTLKL
ncbi:hypothetical protein [Serratia proteamaculans]|uniref:hypothetical protein n=1 Tax=Serratia proteamaculans TaxID=28151 RepID=UPI0021BDB9B1|nr:hypothetical protein [Serratia proteamaculans]